MGGSTPQTQQTQQTQNTTSTSEPSPYTQPWLKNIVDKFGGYLNQHPSAPSLYGESFTAPQSQATKDAIAAFTTLGMSGTSPLNQANTALATNTLGGQFLDPGNNPYLQKYLRAGLDQQNDSFNALTVPGIRSQFAGSGRNLGGLDVDAVLRARNNLDRAQADATAGAEAGAYGDERGRQLQTQSMLPSFQGMDLARAGALSNAGNMWDTYNQKLRDEAILRDTYDKTGDLDYWSSLASRFGGAYPGGTTTGSGTSSGYCTFMPAGNPTSSILGDAMGAAGLGLQLAKFLPFSDRRLKTDIKPVGKTYDGQNVYSYRLLGEPHHQIGLMAQEVEQRHPEAMVTDRAGWKHVDYRRATAHAAPAGGLM